MNNKTKGKSQAQRKRIETNLIEQLKTNGTYSEFYADIINDYMDLWDIKNNLIQDIKSRGVTVTYNHGGGQSGRKQNDSIQGLVKISDRMGKLLLTMGIKPENVITDDGDDFDL